MNRHLQLEELFKGRLSEGEQIAAEDHLEGCLCCQDAVERLCADDLIDPWMPRDSATPLPLADEEIPRFERLKAKMPDLQADNADTTVYGQQTTEIVLPGPYFIDAPEGTLGKYRVIRRVGGGSYGLVYEACHSDLGRVAIKVLKPHLAGQRAFREQFLHEARAASQIVDNHLVAVRDVGTTDDITFLVMDFVDGQTVAELIKGQSALGSEDASKVVRQVAIGAGALHARGVVHRDIKPSNILRDSDTGRYKLADMGLAYASGETEAGIGLGPMIGTPAYMSPEQIAGGRPTPASDVFSLGVVLYELLSGTRPFNSLDDRRMQTVDDVRRLVPRVPPELEAIAFKCMAATPQKRYANGGELADDLQRWMNRAPVSAKPVSRLRRFWNHSRRHKRLSLSAIVAVAALVATASYSRFELRRTRGWLRDVEYAATLTDLAQTKASVGDAQAARYSLKGAIRILERIPASASLFDDTRHQLAVNYYDMGLLEATQGDAGAARDWYLKAIHVWNRLYQEQPNASRYDLRRVRAWNNIGAAYLAQKVRDKARSAYKTAIDIARDAQARSMSPKEFNIDLGRAYLNLAQAGLANPELSDGGNKGKLPGLVELYGKTIELISSRGSAESDDADAIKLLVDARNNRVKAFVVLNQYADAISDLDALIELDGDNQIPHRVHRAWIKALDGDYDSATSEARTLAEQSNLEGKELFNLACTYSLSARAVMVADNDRRTQSDRDELAEQWKDRAMQLLSRTSEPGVDFLRENRTYLRDSDLAAVRDREDFAALVQRVTGAAPPGAN